MTQDVRVAIIGAGFGGLGMAIRLKQAGIDDFVVLERAAEVGGTWQVNTYPGAQCDIPSILYSFSFAPNPRWSRLYPLQEEIKGYLHRCAEQFGVRPHVRLNHDVLDASWDDGAQRWLVSTSHGAFRANVLVGAMGPFSEPSIPDITGLDSFEGTVFHSASWNHDHELAGERIAVIGTGASAVQFLPKIQQAADRLYLFQRTPTWILPHPDRRVGRVLQGLFHHAPVTLSLARSLLNWGQESFVPGFVYRPSLLRWLELLGRTHLRRQVHDHDLRAQLTPNYAFGCKRPTFSNAYYPALTQPNVEVVTEGIREVRGRSVVMADGMAREVDAIILGTGFRIADNPGFGRLHGRDGRSLAQVWSGNDMQAYLGTTIANFPNFFMLLGPNSVVYTSQVVTIEAQVSYVMDALRAMESAAVTSIEVRPEVQQAFVDHVDDRLQGSVWNSGGCRSYYLSDAGRNVTFWPGFNWQFRRRTSHADLADYLAVPACTTDHMPARTG